MGIKNHLIVFAIAFIGWGCQDDVIPKPKAMLRLEYPQAEYDYLDAGSFGFEKNRNSQWEINAKGDGVTLNYPNMKGSLFITYKKVAGNIDQLLADAQKLSVEHSSRADGILPYPFVNRDREVYGTYFEVVGDAASQSQFYVTDSTDHFVTGSLYFYVKPNYDSIYPAASYLQADIRKIMETLRWK